MARLDSATRTVLYRVAQEALTNVARHAKASQAEVIIQNKDGSQSHGNQDDGKGFDRGRSSLRAKRTNRLGLLGMRERVEMVGGTFCVNSAPGQTHHRPRRDSCCKRQA